MLFKESDLQYQSLDNFSYLTEDESKIKISTVPVLENSRIGIHTVDFSDIEKISEDYDVDYLTAISAVQESNNIDSIAVVIDEAAIIEDSSIANSFDNVIIKPQSEKSTAYQFCEEFAEAYLESGNIDYLNAIINEGFKDMVNSVSNKFKDVKDAVVNTAKEANPANAVHTFSQYKKVNYPTKRALRNTYYTNKKSAVALGAGAAAGAVGLGILGKKVYDYRKAIQMANNKPKSWISQKIASLRSIYAKWLDVAKKETDANKASVIKKAASQLLQVIDQLLAKLQKAAD